MILFVFNFLVNKEQTDNDQRGEGSGELGERRERGKQRNTNRGLTDTNKGGEINCGSGTGVRQG